VRRLGCELLLWWAVIMPLAAAQGRVVTDTILSPGLGLRAVDETDWLRQTDLTRELQRYPIVVVLPSVRNSFYVNSWADPTSRYEDFVVRDLHEAVVRRYRVDTLREGIAGLSMGGYGALMLALRHPRRFRFAGALSGALSVPSPLEREDTLGVGLLPAIDSAFGPEPNPHRRTHDPFVLFRRTPTAYEYHEVPGGHDWRVWGSALPSLLSRFWIEVTAEQHRPRQ